MDAKERMLRMLSKGKVPDMADLKLGREEFIKLVSEAQAEGLIEGLYISFCIWWIYLFLKYVLVMNRVYWRLT